MVSAVVVASVVCAVVAGLSAVFEHELKTKAIINVINI